MGTPETGRDVLYDYAEAETLWNDSEPTVPGPVGVPAEARADSTRADSMRADSMRADSLIDGEATSVVMARPSGLRRSAALVPGLLLIAALAVAGVEIAPWAFGQRPRAPAAVALASTVRPTVVPMPTVIALAPPAATVPPAAVMPPAPTPTVASPAAPAIGLTVAAGKTERRHHAGGPRQRSRHGESSPASSGNNTEWTDGEPAQRPRRSRLRPIDVVDPFAP